MPDTSPNSYLYTLTINYKPGQQTQFWLYPTGCVDSIAVNDAPIPIDFKRNCNRDVGFLVDLTDKLHEGENTVKITLSNYRFFHGSRPYDAATYGLQFGPLFFGDYITLSEPISCLLIICLCMTLTLFLRRFTGEMGSGGILSSGLLMYLRQIRMTSYMQYTIDMPSHFHYICFIANHGYPPDPWSGWEYYHPPLYYQIEAKIIHWCNWLGSFDVLTMMRLFSLSCFMVFIVFSTLILKRLIANRLAYYAVLLMLVFYPSGIFYSPRLDSHLLLYSFYAACLYFLMRWICDNRIRYFWLALIFFGLGIATRSNALALTPLIATAFVYQLYKKHFTVQHLLSLGMLVSLCVVAWGSFHNFGRTAHFRETSYTEMPYIVGNIYGIDRRQYVETNTEHLFSLHTMPLFNPPFMDWYHDGTGRQYFWIGVLKTSLFEHSWFRSWGLAKRLLGLLLASIAYVVVSPCCMRIAKHKEWYLCAIGLTLSLVALMMNRIYHPFAPSQDFRYIYPSLVCFCGMFGVMIEQHLTCKHYISAAIGLFIALWFSWSSIGLVIAG